MYRHAAFAYKNKMYIYGGKLSVVKNSNKVYAFDTEAKTFERFKNLEVDQNNLRPPEIEGHSANLYSFFTINFYFPNQKKNIIKNNQYSFFKKLLIYNFKNYFLN